MLRGIWIDRRGKRHKIKDMVEPYLCSAMKSCKHQLEILQDDVGDGVQSTREWREIEQKYKELREEYMSRKRAYLAQYDISTDGDVLDKADVTLAEEKEFRKIMRGMKM